MIFRKPDAEYLKRGTARVPLLKRGCLLRAAPSLFVEIVL